MTTAVFLASPPEGFLQATEAVSRLPLAELEMLVMISLCMHSCACARKESAFMRCVAGLYPNQADAPGTASMQVSAATQRKRFSGGHCRKILQVIWFFLARDCSPTFAAFFSFNAPCCRMYTLMLCCYAEDRETSTMGDSSLRNARQAVSALTFIFRDAARTVMCTHM